MSDDDKLLDDMIAGILRLGAAFEKNGMDAPLTIGVTRRVYDRLLRTLRRADFIYDTRRKEMTVEICGVRFEPTARQP